MAILGIASVIFGVEHLETCTRFWNDFGLMPVCRNPSFFVPDSAGWAVSFDPDGRSLDAFRKAPA